MKVKPTINRVRETLSTSPGFAAMLVACFCMAFSHGAARAMIVIAGLFLVYNLIRDRRWPFLPPSIWFVVFLVGIAVVATLYGIRPEKGVPRLHKLGWLFTIPVAANLLDSWKRVRASVIAYFAGAVILAIDVCINNPLEAWEKLETGLHADFTTSLINSSSLSDGQRLAFGVVAGVAVLMSNTTRQRKRRVWALMLVIVTMGEIVCLKRAPWTAAILFGGGLACTCFGVKRVMTILLIVAGFSLIFSPVRTRIAQLKNDIDIEHGGRMTMWAQVAPELLRQYPGGVGFRSLRNKDLKAIAPHVEPRQDHLHSNPVQIAVALGWHGLAVYMLWMAWVIRAAILMMNHAGDLPDEYRIPAQGAAAMLFALLLVGIVEYNFADAKIMIVCVTLIGICERLGRKPPARASENEVTAHG